MFMTTFLEKFDDFNLEKAGAPRKNNRINAPFRIRHQSASGGGNPGCQALQGRAHARNTIAMDLWGSV
jgi:hypothetical protein